MLAISAVTDSKDSSVPTFTSSIARIVLVLGTLISKGKSLFCRYTNKEQTHSIGKRQAHAVQGGTCFALELFVNTDVDHCRTSHTHLVSYLSYNASQLRYCQSNVPKKGTAQKHFLCPSSGFFIIPYLQDNSSI